MKRREFIAGLGAAAWSLATWAQQGDRVRRIRVLMPFDENDPEGKAYLTAFTQALAGFGLTVGRNVRMDLRWRGGDINQIRALAQELVGLRPDIILSEGRLATAALQRETRTIPIVFANVSDPVASGIVSGLSQPGGNITGFANLEASIGGKWLELLSEIAPGLETAAQSLKVVAITAPVHSDVDIETAIIAFGREPGGGLVVIPDAWTLAHRTPIILTAARNNVSAVYWLSVFAKYGGLLSYGVDQVDTFRRAASYVDRILRGAKPTELPVQLPTRFEIVLNLKTAKALGLSIPESFLLRADAVIE